MGAMELPRLVGRWKTGEDALVGEFEAWAGRGMVKGGSGGVSFCGVERERRPGLFCSPEPGEASWAGKGADKKIDKRRVKKNGL